MSEVEEQSLLNLREGRNVHVKYEEHESPEAPLAFFIHGAGGRCDQYRELFPHFRKEYSILTFDFVGHGNSQKPFNGLDYYCSKEIIEDIKFIFLKYQSHNNNIVIAHSYGTALTTLVFPLINEYIKSVILIGTCKNIPSGVKHPIWYCPVWMLEWLRPMMNKPFVTKAYHTNTRENNQELIDYENSFATKNSMHVMKNLAWGMQWPNSDDFSKLSCPVLIIAGEEDDITPHQESIQVQELIPNSKLHIIKNSAHLPMLENPKETLQVINSFLEENNLPGFDEIKDEE